MRTFDHLLEPLTCYTCDVFKHIDYGKLCLVRLIYGVMLKAMADLHGANEKCKNNAIEYFKSAQFKYHCQCAGINELTMLYIINNPTSTVRVYGEEPDVWDCNESLSEF